MRHAVLLSLAIVACSPQSRIAGRWTLRERDATLTHVFKSDGSYESTGTGIGGPCDTMRNSGTRWAADAKQIHITGKASCTCLAHGETATTSCWGQDVEENRTIDYALEDDGKSLTLTIKGGLDAQRKTYRKEE